ncbi:hypothetical protein AB6G46_10965 [Providencia hangzhouensis]|uniref:hypothetical protein n=1 Tax=Providencia hangzhouensis TaxID=3031799 RepID=UPI0024AA5762
MFALLIIPILVSGYITIILNQRVKWTLNRNDGQLLYLKTAARGFLCLFVAFIFLIWFDYFFDNARYVVHSFFKKHLSNDTSISFDYIFSLVTISLATIATAYLYVFVKYIFDWVRSDGPTDELIEISVNNSTQEFLYESFKYGTVLLFTLSSKKVYAGIILDLSEPSEKVEACQQIKLFPFYSGYREKDKLEVKLKPYDYQPKGDTPEEDERLNTTYQVILFLNQITQISLFDIDLYEKNKKKNKLKGALKRIPAMHSKS